MENIDTSDADQDGDEDEEVRVRDEVDDFIESATLPGADEQEEFELPLPLTSLEDYHPTIEEILAKVDDEFDPFLDPRVLTEPDLALQIEPPDHHEQPLREETLRRRGRHRRRSSEDSSNTWGQESAMSGISRRSGMSDRISVHSDDDAEDPDMSEDEERKQRLSTLGNMMEGGREQVHGKTLLETDAFLAEMKRKAVDMKKKERKATRVRKASQGVIRVDRIPFFTSYMKERRHTIGLPTAMCVRGKLLAIGTSQGVVNVFNTKSEGEPSLIATLERSRWNLENSSAVSSLDVSLVKRWLVCGHRDGHAALWDIQTNTLLKHIDGVHDTGIIHAKFLYDRVRVVTADRKGVVNILAFTWSFFSYSVNVECIADGSLGQVLALTALLPVAEASDNVPLMPSLVAFSTLAGTMVYSVHPVPKVVFTIKPPANTPGGSIPYLSFRRSGFRHKPGVKAEEDRMLAPVMAIAWGKEVQLWQLVPPTSQIPDPSFVLTGSLSTDVVISGLEWLGEQVIVFLNTRDELRVLDPFSLEEVEAIDIKSTGMVYHMDLLGGQEHLTHPGANGNATQTDRQSGGALAVHRSHDALAYHNSVGASVSSCQMFLLGLEGVSCARILSWVDRLKALVRAEEWLDALLLALDFYEGHACAVVGLPRDTDALRDLLEPHVKELMMTYMDNAISESSGIGDNTAHCASISTVCIDYCIQLSCDSDLHFGNELLGLVFQKFCGAGHGGLFLELLESHIMDDNLTTLNPSVMQAFVEHYRDRRMVDRLELCILHMEMTYLDFHQVVTLCRKSRLWYALMYVHNKGLDDYVTPLDELLQTLSKREAKVGKAGRQDDPSGLQGEQEHIKDLAFLYIRSCLDGKLVQHPNAADRVEANSFIRPARVPLVRHELITFIFIWSPKDATRPYPQLDQLIRLDANQFFDILSTIFQINTNEAKQWDSGSDGTVPGKEEEVMLSSQTMADILVSTMVDPLTDPFTPLESGRPFRGGQADKAGFTAEEEGQLMFFLGRWLYRGVINASTELFNRVLAYLAIGVQGGNEASAVERQRLLLNLLENEHMGGKPRDYDFDALLKIAEQADFFKVCLFMHKLQDNYHKVIHNYLKDPDMRPGVFEYIYGLIKDESLPEKAQETVKAATLAHLRSLIQVDSAVTAQLIIGDFSQENSEVLRELEQFPVLQYQYLTGILNHQARQTSVETAGLELTEQMNELYVSLLCNYNPKGVYPFLMTHSDYRLDHCLKLCREHKIPDAEAFLLERTGDVQGALELILKEIDDQIVKLTMYLQLPEDEQARYKQEAHRPIGQAHTSAAESPNPPEVSPQETEIQPSGWIDSVHQEQEGVLDDMYSNMLFMDTGKGANIILDLPPAHEAHALKKSLFVAVNLCRRSNRLEDDESERLWFQLLDQFIEPQLRLKQLDTTMDLPEVQQGVLKTQMALTTFIRTIIYNMMGRVHLTSILRKLVVENGSMEIGEMRSIMQSIFDTFIYERNTLFTMEHILSDDLYDSIRSLHAKSAKALAPRLSRCAICTQGFAPSGSWRGQRILTEQGKSVTLFDCGHIYHKNCLARAQVCPLCDSEEQKFSRRQAGPIGLEGGHGSLSRGGARPHGSGHLRADADVTRDATKRYIKRLEFAERRSKQQGSRLDMLKDLERRAPRRDLHPPVTRSRA